jgi:hypothetical protein
MQRIFLIRWLSVLAFFALTTALGASFSDWQFRQEFSAPTSGVVKLSLPLATLDAARADLGDLRLADAAGKEVPYLLVQTTPEGKTVRPARSFRVELGQSSTLVWVETGLSQPLGAVSLLTPATAFIKAVSVAGSRDGSQWEPITSGQPIFHQPNGAIQLRILLPAGTWPYLRLTVDDRGSQPIPFTGVQVESAEAEPTPAETLEVRIVERTEQPGETHLRLDLGAANVRVAALEFESPEPLFRRQVSLSVRQVEENRLDERVLVTGTIYRVAVAGQPASEWLKVPLEQKVPTRELLVTVRNGDSPPLQVARANARHRPVYLIFLAASQGTHQLYLGNRLCEAPRYDLSGQVLDWRAVGLLDIRPGPVAANPAYRVPEALPQVAATGAALDVADWRYRKAVRIERAGVQQLDLDLEVLAHAQDSGADLRLLQDGRQVPFIIDRTTTTRTLKLEASAAEDSKRPKVSRWAIALPFPNLPLARLSCSSPNPLFQREAVLYEDAVDDRGTSYRHYLGNASWVQSPGSAPRSLSISISGRPTTKTLYLEIDNLDNPPIAMTHFEAQWPLTRLVFKTASSEGLFLYYGNPQAGAPRYDLSLVAGELMRAERSTVRLEGEETLKAPSWAERQAPGQASWLLWTVLALVVVGLLVIIGRLMPKPPSPPGSHLKE